MSLLHLKNKPTKIQIGIPTCRISTACTTVPHRNKFLKEGLPYCCFGDFSRGLNPAFVVCVKAAASAGGGGFLGCGDQIEKGKGGINWKG